MASSTPPLRQMLAGWLARWQLIIILYAANLGLALLLALVPAFGLLQMGRLTALNDAAQAIRIPLIWDLLSPLLQVDPQGETMGIQGAGTIGLSFVLIGLAAPFLALLMASFLAGGVYRAFARSSTAFSLGGFLKDSLAWFFPALAVYLLIGLAAVVLLIPSLVLVPVLMGISRLLGWLVIALVVVLFSLVLLVGELALAAMTAANSRSLGVGFSGAFRCLFKRPLSVLAVVAIALAAAALVQVIFRLLLPLAPGDQWLLVLLLTQLFVIGRVAARLLRNAGETALVTSA